MMQRSECTISHRKGSTSSILLFAVVGLVLISFSCSYFTEPKPEMNISAHPPQTHSKNGVFSNYSADQVVTGTITPLFVPDWSPSGTDSIAVFVDSINIGCLHPWYDQGYSYNNPFQFSINTTTWPDGRQNFMLYAYKKPTIGDSIGLLSLKYNTLYVYETSLIFDNTPPTAPTNVLVTLQNNCPCISWTPTNLSNFYAYVIRRDGNVIDTVYSQKTSSYTDSTTPDFYRGYYEVGASNGPVTAYSTKDSCTRGESLGINFVGAIDNIINDQVVFNLSNNYLTAVSTQTHTVANQCYNGHNGIWAKSVTNDTLYCWDNQNLYTYDARTLDIVGQQQIQQPTQSSAFALMIGPRSQIYVAIAGNGTQGLYVFHKNDAEINIGSSPAAEFSGINFTCSCISPDGKTLLVTTWNAGVRSYVLSNDSVIFNFKSTIMYTPWILSWTDWKNSRIYVAGANAQSDNDIEAWDASTLNFICSYQIPVSQWEYLSAIFVNSQNLFVACRTILNEFDVPTGKIIRSWTFSSNVQSLYGSDNGRYLFACTSTDQWIVDIGGNP